MAQCAACGYTSGWGDAPAEAAGPTSYVARTFLQPQLQKATRWGETATKGDWNLALSHDPNPNPTPNPNPNPNPNLNPTPNPNPKEEVTLTRTRTLTLTLRRR